MPQGETEILRKDLALPPEARAAPANSLLESLDSVVDASAEEAWSEEIARRVEELDSGKVKPVLLGRSPSSNRGHSEWPLALQIHPAALEELSSAISWSVERSEVAAGRFVGHR